MSRSIRIERVIPASPERVYRAWLEPEVLARWLAPVGWSVGKAEVDERVGGRLRCWQLDPDGNEAGGFDSEIVELVPDEKIVFSWNFVGPDRVIDEAATSRLTLLFAAAEGGTAVTLIHDELDGLAAGYPFIAENVEAGWTGTLGRLAEVLA